MARSVWSAWSLLPLWTATGVRKREQAPRTPDASRYNERLLHTNAIELLGGGWGSGIRRGRAWNVGIGSSGGVALLEGTGGPGENEVGPGKLNVQTSHTGCQRVRGSPVELLQLRQGKGVIKDGDLINDAIERAR